MTQETLESTVEKESKKFSWKHWAVDTGALVSYSFAVGSAMEALYGLTVSQMLKSRCSMAALHVTIGRLFGKYRNLVNRKLGVTKQSGYFRRALADTLTTATFVGPIYATVLYFATRGDWEKVAGGTALQTVLAAPIGTVFGWYQDKVRKLFGVPTEYQK